jgi:hypothetical protein
VLAAYVASKRKAPSADELDERERAVVSWLADAPALSATQWRSIKPLMPHLEARLRARGFEVGKTLRRPLRAQVLSFLEQQPQRYAAKGALQKAIAGANKKELDAALLALVHNGAMVQVIRLKTEGYALAEPTQLVSRAELLRVHDALKVTQALLRRALGAKGSKMHVLQGDLLVRMADGANAAPLPRAARTAHTADATGNGAAKDAQATDLSADAAALQARIFASAVPLRIPDLLRAQGLSPHDGARLLTAGARAGLYMLEPESGMGRLLDHDKPYCIPGPQGTLLTWVSAARHAAGHAKAPR